MSGSEVYAEGDLILVRDQYQPLNPIPAVFERYSTGGEGLAKVRYRESGTGHWIAVVRIIGRDTRAQEDRRDD